MPEQERCPRCESVDVARDSVDIGVGVQHGPLGCYTCGWVEGDDGPRPEDFPDYNDLPW